MMPDTLGNKLVVLAIAGTQRRSAQDTNGFPLVQERRETWGGCHSIA